MDFVRGLVVRSKAGHDKYGFFVVLEGGEKTSIICDGGRRSLEKPKKKNNIHLAPTNVIMPNGSMQTNRAIKKALRELQAEAGSDI